MLVVFTARKLLSPVRRGSIKMTEAALEILLSVLPACSCIASVIKLTGCLFDKN